MEECYRDKGDITSEELLVIPLPELSDNSILETAAEGQCMTFLSCIPCHDASKRIWRGGLESHASNTHVLIFEFLNIIQIFYN